MAFASRGGVGVTNKPFCGSASSALPGRFAASLADRSLINRKETHHPRACL